MSMRVIVAAFVYCSTGSKMTSVPTVIFVPLISTMEPTSGKVGVDVGDTVGGAPSGGSVGTAVGAGVSFSLTSFTFRSFSSGVMGTITVKFTGAVGQGTEQSCVAQPGKKHSQPLP